jgi:hypothetical protein
MTVDAVYLDFTRVCFEPPSETAFQRRTDRTIISNNPPLSTHIPILHDTARRHRS